jgi:hypothetical protein
MFEYDRGLIFIFSSSLVIHFNTFQSSHLQCILLGSSALSFLRSLCLHCPDFFMTNLTTLMKSWTISIKLLIAPTLVSSMKYTRLALLQNVAHLWERNLERVSVEPMHINISLINALKGNATLNKETRYTYLLQPLILDEGDEWEKL